MCEKFKVEFASYETSQAEDCTLTHGVSCLSKVQVLIDPHTLFALLEEIRKMLDGFKPVVGLKPLREVRFDITPISQVIFRDKELKQFRPEFHDLVSVSLFVGNWEGRRAGGYFDIEIHSQPKHNPEDWFKARSVLPLLK